MKLKDLAFIGAVVLLLAPFFLSNDLYAAYLACNASHPVSYTHLTLPTT